ncbi:MAG: hypothetical protein MUF33_03395 [Candidatus Nanopelagicales bacterium]|jgi:hypothetical protein|nr:hypothetical protein [Candidatus Nanopelagicales bacterium]
MRKAIVVLALASIGLASPAAAADLTPVLRIAKSTAPVGEDVPYTIRVTPKGKAQGKRVRIQVQGRVTWIGFDTFRIPASGEVSDDVEGFEPGIGRYRVLVLGKNGTVVAKSAVVTVGWTPRVP